MTVTGSTRLEPPVSGVSTTTFNGFLLNTVNLNVRAQTALLTGNAVITTTGPLSMTESSGLNLNSGSLNLAANVAHNINSGTMNVNGGSLNLGANSTLNVNSLASRLNFSGGFNVINNSLLRAQSGGDIVGSSFIDVGNGGVGFLTINNSDSTLVAQSSTSDWGREASGRAVVDIFTGGTATVAFLRVGTVNAQASLNVAGGTLNVNNTLSAGGGATSRSVQMTVQNSGTMNVNGAATFDNQADLNLVSGTLDFNSSATFNAGSRLDITGGTLDTTNQLLTINGGTLTSTTSGALSSSSALRVQAGGTANFSGFFDIGNGNSASLTVTGAGSNYTAGGLSDWGRGSSGGATVTIDDNALATLNGLRIGTDNGSAIVTVASGGQLRPSGLTVGGGSTARTVNLNINGGTVTVTDVNSITSFNDKAVLNLQAGTFDPKGDVTFFPGSVANISGGTFLTASGKTLTVSGGTINRTNPATTGISPGSTLAINSAGKFESVGSISVGEFGTGTVTVDGTNSVFRTSTNLTLGGTSAGLVGTVTSTNGGRILVGDAANQSGIFAENDMFVSDLNATGSNQGGLLKIANGSMLNHAGNIIVASLANQFGQVRVEGTNSQLVSNGLAVLGLDGNATLDVQSGGKVQAAVIVHSFDPGSISTSNVTGTSSLLRANGDFVVGRAGTSVMNITAGGRAESGDLTILGEVAGGNGTINVNGASSTLAVGSTLEVGRDGAGLLNIVAGGNVTASDVSVGNAGVLRVFNSSINSSVTLLPNSRMSVDNSAVGPLSQQTGADLNFTLRGLSDFDNVAVLGAAILEGDLFVSLDNGFTPQQGHSFELLTATGGVNASFSSLSFPALSGGLEWQLNSGSTSLILSVIGSGVDGDFNNDGLYNCGDINELSAVIAGSSHVSIFDLTGDGLVNLADRDAWLVEAGGVNIGTGRAYRLGDANLDGVVDGSDFGIWNGSKFTSNTAWCSGNFNGDAAIDGSDFGLWNSNKFTSSDRTSVVPEPSVLSGLLVVLYGLAARRGVKISNEVTTRTDV